MVVMQLGKVFTQTNGRQKGLQCETSSVPSQTHSKTYNNTPTQSIIQFSFKNVYLCRWSRNSTFLWNPKVHKCSWKSTTLGYILSHLNPVQTLTLHFTRIHFKIFSDLQLGHPSDVFNYVFLPKFCIYLLFLILLDLNAIMIQGYEL